VSCCFTLQKITLKDQLAHKISGPYISLYGCQATLSDGILKWKRCCCLYGHDAYISFMKIWLLVQKLLEVDRNMGMVGL